MVMFDFGLTLSAFLVSGQVMMCPYNHRRAFLQEQEYTIVPMLYRSRNKRSIQMTLFIRSPKMFPRNDPLCCPEILASRDASKLL